MATENAKTPAPATPQNTAEQREQRKQWRERRTQQNIELAAKPTARVMEVNTPFADIMFQILRQMEMAWKNLKARSGEPGGVSYEEMGKLVTEMQMQIVGFHHLTKKIAKKSGFRYKNPAMLGDILEKIEKEGQDGLGDRAAQEAQA